MQLLYSLAYYVAFGPHGPRAPTSQPGDNIKILFSTLALVAAAGALFVGLKSLSAYNLTLFLLGPKLRSHLNLLRSFPKN